MQCPKCGTSLREGDVFCKSCGARLVNEQVQATEQDTEVNKPNLMRQPNHNEQGKTKIIEMKPKLLNTKQLKLDF